LLIEEIQKIIEYPDRRIKPLILCMVSGGFRLGAWDYLKWKHVIPLKNKEDESIDFFDLNNESILKQLHYSIIYLNDKKEYDTLIELNYNLKYHKRIVESFGYNPYTGDVDEKKFPITKEDKQMKNIAKDFDRYFQALSEYYDYLKELIKKYDIKPIGNLVKRLAFNIQTDSDDDDSSKSKEQHFKFVTAVIDFKDFFPDV